MVMKKIIVLLKEKKDGQILDKKQSILERIQKNQIQLHLSILFTLIN